MTSPAKAACVFDAYGTLFNVHSAVGRHANSLGKAAAEISNLWRTKQLEYSWVHSLMRRHVDFWELTQRALDYASNVALYPKFQAYFRQKHPPLLAVWGKNDPFFLPPGAEAFKRDNPNAEVHFYDTGHFALETHGREIAAEILSFLGRTLPQR